MLELDARQSGDAVFRTRVAKGGLDRLQESNNLSRPFFKLPTHENVGLTPLPDTVRIFSG